MDFRLTTYRHAGYGRIGDSSERPRSSDGVATIISLILEPRRKINFYSSSFIELKFQVAKMKNIREMPGKSLASKNSWHCMYHIMNSKQ